MNIKNCKYRKEVNGLVKGVLCFNPLLVKRNEIRQCVISNKRKSGKKCYCNRADDGVGK